MGSATATTDDKVKDMQSALEVCNNSLNECKASLTERDEQITKLNTRLQSYKLRTIILYAVMGVLLAVIIGLGVWIFFLNKDKWFKNKKGNAVSEMNSTSMNETVYTADDDVPVEPVEEAPIEPSYTEPAYEVTSNEPPVEETPAEPAQTNETTETPVDNTVYDASTDYQS